MAKRKARPKKPRIDYDGIYHRLFENPAIVAELLRGFVDADLLADLELEGMQPHGTKSHTRSGRRDGDMVWRIPRRDGDDAYLVLLLEFQSTNEQYMAVRLLTYAGLLWQRIITARQLTAGRKLPPVLPVVLFNGGTEWNAPALLQQLVALPADSPLWPYQPALRFTVIDIGAFGTAELEPRKGLIPLWFQLENALDQNQFLQAVQALKTWFSDHPGHSRELKVVADLVTALFTRLDPDIMVPAFLLEDDNMLIDRVEQWIADGKQEARKEGRKAGRQEGAAIILLRQLEHRFGVLPEVVRARVQSADTDLLADWSMRILTAESLDGVFGDRPAGAH
jgi:hypothetical protein